MSEREIVHLTEEEKAWCRENFNFVTTMGGKFRTFPAKMRLTPDLRSEEEDGKESQG